MVPITSLVQLGVTVANWVAGATVAGTALGGAGAGFWLARNRDPKAVLRKLVKEAEKASGKLNAHTNPKINVKITPEFLAERMGIDGILSEDEPITQTELVNLILELQRENRRKNGNGNGGRKKTTKKRVTKSGKPPSVDRSRVSKRNPQRKPKRKLANAKPDTKAREEVSSAKASGSAAPAVAAHSSGKGFTTPMRKAWLKGEEGNQVTVVVNDGAHRHTHRQYVLQTVSDEEVVLVTKDISIVIPLIHIERVITEK